MQFPMSDLRIALIAEGPTDYVVIEAALKAILDRPFILNQLQPEATRPDMGSGWGGVLKWCYKAAQRCPVTIAEDPTLIGYDLVILHLDLDVATFSYADCGNKAEALAQKQHWGRLPCARPCPPVTDSCEALQQVLQTWLHPATLGTTILCIPAQSTGTWLAAAYLPDSHELLDEAECNTQLESRLVHLSLRNRVKKNRRDYQKRAENITDNWVRVKNICSQAVSFESDIINLLSPI